jgi:hypothetical protein
VVNKSAACGVKGEDDPAFARGEHDRMPACRSVDRRDLQVPVMKVVGERLVIPLQLARSLVELDDAVRIQFATRTCLGIVMSAVRPIQVPGTRLLTLASVALSAPRLQTTFAVRPPLVVRAACSPNDR